jgi:DNA-binding NarL/FixJ family response regulator
MAKKRTMPAGAERDDLIRKLYAEGVSQSDIARRIGVSRQRLHQLLDELRVRKRKRLTPQERERKILAMIRAGKTGQVIADELAIGKTAVYRDIARLKKRMPKTLLAQYQENRVAPLRARRGIRHPLYAAAIDKRRSRIMALIERGWSLGRIGEKLGCTGQTIRNDLTAMGTNAKLEAKIHANRVAEGRKTRASH